MYLAHTVLSGAFKSAAKWQLVRANIIRDVDAPKVQHKEIEVFTPDEGRRILSEARTSPLEAAYVLALSTGMRGGEVFALQPQDYNAADGTLAIRRTLVNNGTQVGTPKSKNSYRKVQLAPVARDALERHLRNGGLRVRTHVRAHEPLAGEVRPLSRACARGNTINL